MMLVQMVLLDDDAVCFHLLLRGQFNALVVVVVVVVVTDQQDHRVV